MTDAVLHKRLIEALLFAAPEPLAADEIQTRLPDTVAAADVLADLARDYAERGVNLVEVAGRWQFRSAPDLGGLLRIEVEVTRRLSRAALETLAIIAYHQPVTRAEVEDIRGVSVSRGTLDLLLEAGWIKPRGHREAPGRPVLWVTTEAFLEHFGLAALDDLPGVGELKASGLLGPAVAMPGLDMADLAAADSDANGDANGDVNGDDDEPDAETA
ncbi:MAG: SMC-Scp complex subunit ScpB [Alphaproteobacteria bacterium]